MIAAASMTSTNQTTVEKTAQSSSQPTLPDWEVPVAPKRQQWSSASFLKDARLRVEGKLDRYLPNQRRYLGLRRRSYLILLLIAFALLFALILGLAIGLSRHKRFAIASDFFLHSPVLHRHSSYQSLPLSSKQYQGDLTYYSPGLGACGVTSSQTDKIVSISHFTFDSLSKGSNPNANPLCGHKLRAVRDGRSVDLTVVDRCALPLFLDDHILTPLQASAAKPPTLT